ncbi:hypothetical protein DID80_00310 [Candidatus Marinamargulisbacteria bacterium SCGC AAA071-K20]|nr:hypothetical protein DID80_00310 [Candidatus Marinamargulisbacteria bacterium SCGC AAA071-K20]
MDILMDTSSSINYDELIKHCLICYQKELGYSSTREFILILKKNLMLEYFADNTIQSQKFNS